MRHRQSPYVAALGDAITAGETIGTTGLVLQELLQGFAGPKARAQILERFSAVLWSGALDPTPTYETAVLAPPLVPNTGQCYSSSARI